MRWLKTLRGFTGLGGLHEVWCMMTDPTRPLPEDLTLQDVMAPDARHIEVDGKAVAIREAGPAHEDTRAPAVIFIHGFAEHLGVWRPVQDRIAQTRRTVALDLWGFGASARPAQARPADWVREVTGVMDALGIERAVLVGHSLGGRVSLMTARAHPERVAGLVLVDADWGQAPHGYVLVWLLAHTPALPLALTRLRSNPAHIQRTIDMICTPNHSVTEEAFQGLFRPRRVEGTVACWRSLGRAAPLRDVRGLPDSVSCPVTVLWGADDPVVPLWAGRKLAAKLGCDLTVFEQCGHFPPEEYPERTAEWLEEFLGALDTND